MLSLFKKAKKTTTSTDRSIGGQLAKELEKKYLFVQEKWAEWMTKKTSKLSRSSLLLLWAFFFTFSVGYSIALIVNGFLGSSASSITITPIVTLEKQVKTVKPVGTSDSSRRKEEFEEKIRFRLFMDSLVLYPTRKQIEESVVNKRPKVRGSHRILEK